MAFKASGNACDVFREHLLLNSGSFTTTNGVDSDFFPETSRIDGMPARPAHVHDTTAYATNPIEDSWSLRLHGSGSVANTNGSQRGGNLT
jgi:hypothetical protein